MSNTRPIRGINLVIALVLILWMAAMYLTDLRAAPDAPDCDPVLMADDPHYPSSDERYTATDFTVIDVQAGRCKKVAPGVVPQFVGWTADGRYAIFNGGDQYGSGRGRVFDTKKWLEVPVAFRSDARPCSHMSGECNFAAVAIAPVKKRVVFEDGTLIYLSNSQHYTLLGDAPDHLILTAAFSPGEQYLAYVRYRFIDNYQMGEDYAVYVANGDGSDPRHLYDLDPQSGNAIRLEWYQDGTPKFRLHMGEAETIINVWTGEIIP